VLFGSKMYSTLRKNLSIVISFGVHSVLLISYLAYNLISSNDVNIKYGVYSMPINIVNESELKTQNHPQILQKNFPKTNLKGDEYKDKSQNNNQQNNYIHSQVSYEDLIANDGNSIPPYPLIAKINKWEGEVILKVIVDIQGSVDSIEIKKSSGHKILDDTAQKAIKAWKIPNNSGKNIIIEIPVMFKLRTK